MEAGLDVCYLYERYLLTQQIACLCLFSVTSAGSTLNKKFLAPVVCHCGSNTMGPAGVKSAVCVIPGSRETQPQAGLCLVAGHSWICTAGGSCCCCCWPRDPWVGPCPPQVMAGLRVEPVELRAARDDPQNPRVTGRLCPVPWPILDVLPEPLGSPGWVLWQECAMLLAQGLACALCVTYGVLLPAMCRHPWHPRGDEAGMCQAGAALQPGGRGEGSGGELRGLWFPAQLRWSPGHQPRDGAELLWGCSSSS